jgi:uncharacterized protein (TIGR00645 family)
LAGTSIERVIESGIFKSRWIVAPFYIGLVIALGMLLVVFVEQLAQTATKIFTLGTEEVILGVLALIDLSLAANLVIIVVFSGYENFISKIDTGDSEDRPSWMGTLDFSGLKMKLIGSIVAISAISLLRSFMELTQPQAAIDNAKLAWLVGLHMTFLASGVFFALMDWLASITAERVRATEHAEEVARHELARHQHHTLP